MPHGILFPISHIKDVVSDPKSGKKFNVNYLFIGLSLAEPYKVSVLIRRKTIHTSNANPAIKHLHPLSTWIARLAYCPVTSYSSIPDFEMDVRYWENGIVKQLVEYYDSHTIVADLNQLEFLPEENR